MRAKNRRRKSNRLRHEQLESRLLLAAEWLDSTRDYRVELTVNSNGFERTDKPADIALNFTSLLGELGENTAVDIDSLRVVEVDTDGQPVNTNVPFQFDPDPGFDASTMATGTLVVMVEGQTAASEDRIFQTYFDVVGGTFTPASFPDLVAVTDNVADEGQDSFQITTPTADYFYQKQGAGYSSIVDVGWQRLGRLSSNGWFGWSVSWDSESCLSRKWFPSRGYDGCEHDPP